MYLCVFVWMWEEGGGMCEVGGIVSKFAKFDLVCGGICPVMVIHI